MSEQAATSESNVNDTYGINDTRGPNVTMPARDQYLVRIEVTILSVMFTVMVIGNVLALIALGARRRRQLSRMHYFILHLCISDLIVAFFNVLPQLITDITGRFIGEFPGDNILCKCFKFGQVFAPYLSSYVLVVTAIDRYQAICFPLKNCSWTARRSKIMIACAWLVSALGTSPQLFIFSYTRVEPYAYNDCWATFIQPWGEQAYVTWSMVLLFIIPLFILVFTYSCICRTIWVNFKNTSQNPRIAVAHNDEKERELLNGQILNNIGNSYANGRKMSVIDDDNETTEYCSVDSTGKNNDDSSPALSASKNRARSNSTRPPVHPIRSHNSTTRISRAKIKTVKLTVSVILCYIACSLPFFSSMMYVTCFEGSQEFSRSYAFTIMSLLLSLNSCVNPWLYLIFNENMARTLRDLFCHCEKPELHGGQTGTPFSRGSVSESRLATILTLSRIHCNQMELKNINNMNTANGSLKVPNSEEKSQLVNQSKVNGGPRGSLTTSLRLKNNNCNIITYAGHKCDDSRVVHNCKQL